MTTTFIKHHGSRVVLSVITTILLMTSHVIAADTSGTSTAKEVNGAALEEIIVTAERREEKLDKVPISPEAITGLNSLQYFGNPNFVVNGQVLNSYTNFQTTDVQEALFDEVAVDIVARACTRSRVPLSMSRS